MDGRPIMCVVEQALHRNDVSHPGRSVPVTIELDSTESGTITFNLDGTGVTEGRAIFITITTMLGAGLSVAEFANHFTFVVNRTTRSTPKALECPPRACSARGSAVRARASNCETDSRSFAAI